MIKVRMLIDHGCKLASFANEILGSFNIHFKSQNLRVISYASQSQNSKLSVKFANI